MFDVSDNVQKINLINRRLFIITAAKLVVFLGLSSRLFSLQVNQNNNYQIKIESENGSYIQ